MTHKHLRRFDEARLHILNPQDVPVTLFANAEVTFEPAAVDEILKFLVLRDTLARLADAFFWGTERPGMLRRVVLTPDLHRGAGIPVGTVVEADGFVLPRAVGNDICCGMRLLSLDVSREEITPVLDQLPRRLRQVFFSGQREIPMSPLQREAVLREGLYGLLSTAADNAGSGTWSYYNAAEEEKALLRTHLQGSLPTRGLFNFADFIRGSGASDGRDAQTGSIGGGNHFVEIQVVEDILEGPTAETFGLRKNMVTVMAHTGSVGLGHAVGGHFMDKARALYPQGLPHPEHGFYALPTRGPNAEVAAAYISALHNAANFAFVNRLFLGLLVVRVLSEALGRRVQGHLVYDAPHNLIWPGEEGVFRHRKGACPAYGPDACSAGPYRYTGQPVIIPGSMGDASYVMAGEGNEEALSSACHGAGRILARGRSGHVEDAVFDQVMEPLRVVTPIDPENPEIRFRRDILAKHRARLKEEAPYAYKPIQPVVDTIAEAGIARPVAKTLPLLTVKG